MDRDSIQAVFNRLVDTGLPREIVYKSDKQGVEKRLTAAQAASWQKLKFSEWGVDRGYDESIVVKLSDFPDGIDLDAEIDMKDTDGEWYGRWILDVNNDAAGCGAIVALGAKWSLD